MVAEPHVDLFQLWNRTWNRWRQYNLLFHGTFISVRLKVLWRSNFQVTYIGLYYNMVKISLLLSYYKYYKQLDIFHRVFPESARWLAAKGHLAQAHAVLMKYASKSSLSVDSDSIMTKLTEYHQSEVESRADSSSRRSFLDLIRSPRLRKRTVILSFNW